MKSAAQHAEPSYKRLSQSSVKSKLSRCVRQAASGEKVFRITTRAGERFAVIESLQDSDGPAIEISIEFAKEYQARLFALVKSGLSFRVVSKRNAAPALVRPYRKYRDPFQPLLEDWAGLMMEQQLHDERLERTLRALEEERLTREVFLEEVRTWMFHAVRSALGHRPDDPDRLMQQLRRDDPDGVPDEED